MGQRLELQDILEEILGSTHVYYQPPETLIMEYPCIRYHRRQIDIKYADNKAYNHTNGYEVTLIESDPDSETPDKILSLPYCSFSKRYVSDNLYHSAFLLYF